MTVMDALVTAYRVNPEATASLIDDVVTDLMVDEAIDNATLLNKAAGAYIAQQTAVAKRALLRQYAQTAALGQYPDDEIHKAAEWLAGIEAYTVSVVTQPLSKAMTAGTEWKPEDERKHRRDTRGRFTRGVNQNKTSNPQQYTNPAQVMPYLRGKTVDQQGKIGGIDATRAAQVQAQYEQADEILREFGDSFSARDRKKVDAIIQFQDSDGTVGTLNVPLSQVSDGMNDALYGPGKLKTETNILNISVDANDPAMQAQVDRFNALGAMGGKEMARLGNISPEKRGALTQALMPRGPEKGKLETMFGRFRAGADVLDSTGNEKLGSLARFMGEYGPEAEKVLDPRVRQAAYRYRGTEKEPDIELMRQMNSPGMNTIDAVARERGHGPVSDSIKNRARTPGTSPMLGTIQHHLSEADRSGEPLSEDQITMRTRSDLAAMHMLRTLPLDRMVADLSQKSGNILPSQGVLIDADGDVVSQAVGSGDDTYLPFDYTNMKRSMKGGQYVRTRVQGGLTGEDIAAAVGNGARMATVVSSSGVHSLELDPNLRGQRGAEKAREMSRRYIQILDAVENSGLYTQDIDPREKAKLRAQAAEISGQHEGPDFQGVYRQLENDARAKASQLSEEEMDGLMDQAKKMVAGEGGSRSPENQQRRINDVYSELEEQAAGEKAKRLRLNAEGYQVALQTLQQQFPYFIRNVSYEPLAGKDGGPGFLNNRGQQGTAGSLRQRLGATDQGYMRPGGIRASSVQGGFYRTDQPMQGAQGASSMKQPLSGERFEAAKAPPTPPAGPEAAGTPAGPEGTPPSPEGGTPAAPGLTGPVGGPQGGLMAQAGTRAREMQVAREQALTDLSNIFSSLATKQVNLENTPAGKPWEQVARGNNELVARWFFGQSDPQAALSDPAKAARLAAALTDRKSVANAFKGALQDANNADFFAEGGSFGPGNDTPEKAAAHAADLAMKIVDTDLVTQPFTNPIEGPAGRYHKGDRPQALKINGTDINSLDSADKFNAFIRDPRNKKIVDMARELGTTEGGDDYRSTADVGNDVKERVQLLEDMPKIAAAIRADQAKPGGPGPHDVGIHSYTHHSKLDPAKFEGALTRLTGKQWSGNNTAAELMDLFGPGKRWPNQAAVDAEAGNLQQAWALVSAGQTHRMISPGGGVGRPKVPPGQPQQPAREVFLKAASTRLEVVRKDDSPLAREISRRRAAGEPFVPPRPSRATPR